jgi:CheY-like chemotaxis protein
MSAILIVEDDLFIRGLAEEMIQDWGHQTCVASDVNEAMALLLSSREIDALFTDVYLKKTMHGGCNLARAAINIRPALRVLYTTGNTITEKMNALFIKGTRVLRKPYTEEQLHDSIAGLLAA